MRRLVSPGELKALRESILSERPPDRVRVRICMTGCRAYGAIQIRDGFVKEIEERGLKDDIEVVETGCHGFCARAPVIGIDPQGLFYQQVIVEDVPEIIAETLKGHVIERLMFEDPASGERFSRMEEIPFYREQKRIVLRNCGKIDPKDIREYIARDGYAALAKVLSEMTPEEVIETIRASGLRGRGGAGFPTGLKWGFARRAVGDEKYIVCNADEGDPGAFMDRGVLEGDPHSVLEGIAIAAYAIGAETGYIYVRAEYPIAVEHLGLAIRQAEELGLLGDDIMGTGLNLHIHLKEGAGAFVCGEETALMASIEGKRGMPRPRPPFPANAGLWGKPTNINNVETYANVSSILLNGAEWYASMGTERSKGTKIFSLAGKIVNTGLVEVPMGATLDKVVFDIGGGIPGGKAFKAVQLGGPSGGCIPTRYLDVPIDYDSLTELGAIMGSGGMIVMDEKTCMVEIARFFTEFVQSESCGKCVPCRIGTKRMLEILTRITEGKGEEGDIELLVELGAMIKDSSLCGLGQTAPNPVLSTIRYFREEYEAHIRDKRCPAATCEALVLSPCQHTCPIHENAHTYIGLVAEGKFREAYETTRQRNPFSSICGRVCYHPCESKCRRGELDEPISIAGIKRFVNDYVLASGPDLPEPVPRRWEERVAVIGAGPAGLTAAYHLVKRGYGVTVFEALSVAGGMMAVGIPEYRLPKAVLRREIDAIEALGVEIRLNTPIGKKLSVDDLFEQGYKAVFVGVGAHRSQRLRIPGEEKKGVIGGVDFLRRVSLGESPEVGRRVAVIGGGNVAIDAARSALRLGAEEVTIVYRRSREEMPAHAWEVHEAEAEGVRFVFLANPTRILGRDTVIDIECLRMELGERDESGRRRPVPVKDSEFTMKVDTVIPAIGQVSDTAFLSEVAGVDVGRRGTVEMDPKALATGRPGVFAGGDCTSLTAMVVEAIAAGERGAVAIHKYLRNGDIEPEEKFGWPERRDGRPRERVEADAEEQVDKPKVAMPERPPCERIRDFEEIAPGYTEEQAIAEARRCLQCQYR